MSGIPYSDNMYSAENESDGESFSDELSPTDGYFNRRSLPTDVLVPDPSQEGNTSEDKVLIARREARQNSEMGAGARATDSPTLSQLYLSQADASAAANNNSPPSPISNASSSPVSSRRPDPLYSEHSPLMIPPPPAYSASPTSPNSIISPEVRNYSTFLPHQLEQGLPSRHEPESMGRPYDEPCERTPLAGPPSERTPNFFGKRSSPYRILVRKLLFLALVVAVLVGVLTTMFSWTPQTGHTNAPSYDLPSGPYCTAATIKEPETVFTFDLEPGRDLNVLQTTYEGDNARVASHVTTSGEIRLRLLPKDSERGPHFTLDARASDHELEIRKTWDSDSRTLEVSTPRHAKLGHRGPHCISLEITAWLPHDGKLTNLHVAAISLSLRVLEDVNINLSGKALFASVSGNILFPRSQEQRDIPGFSFNSRKIDIETVSGVITGLYPLYDHLGLLSKSGFVEVVVLPRAIDPTAPAPADLDVKTVSGNIDVRLPIIKLDDPNLRPPPRDYITQVQSTSGSISGSYYLGSSTKLTTTSGGIEGTVLPVIQSSGKSAQRNVPQNRFETWSTSGHTAIELAEPLFISLLSERKPDSPHVPYQPIGDDDPYLLFPPTEGALFQKGKRPLATTEKLRSLVSSHSSTSGTISVRYPPSWEGTILAKAMAGDISITGTGVKTIREKNGWGSKEVLAGKGVDKEGEGSTAEMKNLSGGLKFTVYDV